MKTQISFLAACSLLAVLPIAFTACKTIPETGETQFDPAKVAPLVKIAAYVGTAEGLRSHPEWREGFNLAHAQLVVLEQQETLDWASVLAIVDKLPVKQLKSERATLIITTATILLSEFGGSTFQLDATEIRPIVTALREGIELGLGGTPTPAVTPPVPTP